MRRVDRLLQVAVIAVAVVTGAGCGWIGSGGITPTPSGIHSTVIDDPHAATQKAVAAYQEIFWSH